MPEIYQIDDDVQSNEIVKTTEKRMPLLRFKIQHLMWLTVIIALAFGLRTPDLIYVLISSLTIAISCLGLMIVYVPLPERIQKRMRSEAFFQDLIYKIIVACALVMLFCVCSLSLKALSTDSAESWNEVLKSIDFFQK